MIIDVPTSSVALAVNGVAKEKNKVYHQLHRRDGRPDRHGQCTPNTVHWTYDTYMLAKSTGGALVQAGGDTWFFITADYAFGHALERDTGELRPGAGGKVLGRRAAPVPGQHRLLLLPAPGAAVRREGRRAWPMPARTPSTRVKQAAEFGLTRRGRSSRCC